MAYLVNEISKERIESAAATVEKAGEDTLAARKRQAERQGTRADNPRSVKIFADTKRQKKLALDAETRLSQAEVDKDRTSARAKRVLAAGAKHPTRPNPTTP